ncbi:MAG TPA: methyltransferase domain-containing protein [Chloroflexota bacterium]|jgi:SAM-dependent methyltransferase
MHLLYGDKNCSSIGRKGARGPGAGWETVLDLGCGLGPCGFAAAFRAAQVTFLDRESSAIEIVAASALQQAIAGSQFECVVADWREPTALPRFDLILGSDVLYEESGISPLAAFLAAHLKRDADAWIADPGRPCLGLFFDVLQENGLQVRGHEPCPHTIRTNRESASSGWAVPLSPPRGRGSEG